MMLPRARKDDLVVEEVFDELVVYDLKRNQVHSLNPTAALVWQHCDGHTTPVELLTLLQQELDAPPQEELLWYTLERLQKADLLESEVNEVSPLNGTKITRRQALRKLGIAVAMVPVVTTIVAPRAAQAQSQSNNPCGSAGCKAGYCCCYVKPRRKYMCVPESMCEGDHKRWWAGGCAG